MQFSITPADAGQPAFNPHLGNDAPRLTADGRDGRRAAATASLLTPAVARVLDWHRRRVEASSASTLARLASPSRERR